jgi:hypothetical protein
LRVAQPSDAIRSRLKIQRPVSRQGRPDRSGVDLWCRCVQHAEAPASCARAYGTRVPPNSNASLPRDFSAPLTTQSGHCKEELPLGSVAAKWLTYTFYDYEIGACMLELSAQNGTLLHKSDSLSSLKVDCWLPEVKLSALQVSCC